MFLSTNIHHVATVNLWPWNDVAVNDNSLATIPYRLIASSSLSPVAFASLTLCRTVDSTWSPDGADDGDLGQASDGYISNLISITCRVPVYPAGLLIMHIASETEIAQ